MRTEHIIYVILVIYLGLCFKKLGLDLGLVNIDIAICIFKVVVISFNKYQMNVIGLSLGNSTLGPIGSPGSFTYNQVSKSPKSIKRKKSLIIDPVILSQSLTITINTSIQS